MKTLIGNARNHNLMQFENDNGEGFTVPYTEVVLIATEPAFRTDQEGDLVKYQKPTTHRFSSSPTGLRQLAANLTSYADEADKLQTDFGTPDPADTTPEPNGHADPTGP